MAMVPEVITNGASEKMVQQGWLTRLFNLTNAVERIQDRQVVTVAKMRSEQDMLRDYINETMKTNVVQHKANEMERVAKHYLTLQANRQIARDARESQRDRLKDKICSDLMFDSQIEELLESIGDMGLSPEIEAQYRMKIRQTLKRKQYGPNGSFEFQPA